MKILALTPSIFDTAPGLRFRIEQWAPYLERDGISFTFVPFEDPALREVLYRPGSYGRKAILLSKAFLRRMALSQTATDYDAVYLYREASLIGPAVIEHVIARSGTPIIYDFDDPIWLPYKSPSNGVFSRLKFTSKTASICRISDAVIVGNRLLAAWARRYSSNVHVVPSTIEMARYPQAKTKEKDEVLTLGWTGSHSTLPFLSLIKGPLQRLATRYRFRFLVISHTDRPGLDWDSVNIVGKKWNAATEAADLHEIDIGLAPFPNTGWTPWRCHGKVLQYMASGIPTVTSAIGVLPEYITDGEQGFLVTTESDWETRIAMLIENASLRRQMGAKAREAVAHKFAAHVWAPRVRSILESVSKTRRPMPCSAFEFASGAGFETQMAGNAR